MLEYLSAFLKRLKLSPAQRGSIGVLVVLAIIPLVGFVGIAVDGARGYFVKSKLSQAIDAAGLAGGREIFSPAIQQDINKYFRANFPEGYMDATISGPHYTIDDNNELITITAEATIPTTFMRVFNQDTMEVSARTVIRRSVRGMELALIMDNTGSMRSGGKMDAMKDAAQELIDILYGDREEIQNFWVSLIPYTTTVNIGGHRINWVGNLDPDDFNPTVWKGCVEARDHPLDVSDETFNTEQWPVFFYPDASDNDWPPIREENNWQNDGLGPNLGCGPEMTPLISEKSDIQAAIAEMLPWHRGGTMSNVGMAWGWRSLSPRWRGLWGGDTPAILPLDYNTPYMDKVAILLTDGVNQFYDHPPSGPDGSDYGAYGRLGWGRYGSTNQGVATAEANNRLAEICEQMKQNGIIVYTITFQLNDNGTRQIYRNCATTPAHYFNSPGNDELRDTFRQIGSELSNLRIAE